MLLKYVTKYNLLLIQEYACACECGRCVWALETFWSLFVKRGCTLWLWWQRFRRAALVWGIPCAFTVETLQRWPIETCCSHGSVVAALWQHLRIAVRWAAQPLSRRGVYGVSRPVLNTQIPWSCLGLVSSGQADNRPSVWRQIPSHKETAYTTLKILGGFAAVP